MNSIPWSNFSLSILTKFFSKRRNLFSYEFSMLFNVIKNTYNNINKEETTLLFFRIKFISNFCVFFYDLTLFNLDYINYL